MVNYLHIPRYGFVKFQSIFLYSSIHTNTKHCKLYLFLRATFTCSDYYYLAISMFFFMYVNAALTTYKIVPHIKWSRSSFMILDKNTHPHLNNKKKFKWLYFCVCVKEILENYIISRKTPHKPQ